MLPFLLSKRERLRREAATWVARLEGRPSPDDHDAFRRWYQADPLHAETFDRVKAVYGSAGALAHTELGRARPQAPAPRAARPSAYALAAALAAVIVMASAVLLGRPDSLMPRAEAQTLLYATRVGEIRQIPLADGSRITLDAKSKVQVTIDRSRREVTLGEGRARFEVEPRDGSAFVVAAGDTLVTGKAGSFDVALVGGGATVRPIDGTVSVETKKTAGKSEPLSLRPGQVILVSAGGSRIDAQPAGGSVALWPSGRLDFVKTPLDQVIAEANRYSRGGISLSDQSLSSLLVTGTFRAGDTEALARSLAAAFGLELDQRPEGSFILSSSPPQRRTPAS